MRNNANIDTQCMLQALRLAEATVAQASPNPQVGCVLVRDGLVIGEGAHFYDRLDHAEIVALKQAGDAAGATAYVTLEPCSHHGRTGPCADALITAGVRRVVVATNDPNPEVSGRGIARLRAAGIVVEVGLGREEAQRLNDAFAMSITRGRPFVTLKAALSADGMLAPPAALRKAVEPHWLTGPEARADVQRLRHASDAILTGIGTVLADNPSLTDRTGLPRRRPLHRVILDRHLRTPPTAAILRGGVQIFHPAAAPEQNRLALKAAGGIPTEADSLIDVLANLHRQRFLSVLIEAGAGLNAAFLHAGLVDQVVLYYSSSELGAEAIPFAEGGPASFALEQQFLSVSKVKIGPDVRVSGLLRDVWQDQGKIG